MERFGVRSLSSRSRPFFSALASASGVRTKGVACCELGHVLPARSARRAEGIFVRWEWDGERLVVENDRFGIYPLFYSIYGGEIRISPSIQHVLDGDFPKTLNFPGLAVFLRLGGFLKEDTPFEHVQVLPPASRLTWCRGNIDLERGSLEALSLPVTPGTFDETVEEYQSLFRQAVARRPPPADGYDIALSAGRDSRHILLELIRQGYEPNRTVTVQGQPPIDDEDRVVARLLAHEIGVPHDEVGYPESYVDAMLKDLELTEFCAAPHTWLIPLAGYFKARGTQCVYDGLAGGILSGGQQVSNQKLDLIRDGRTQELAKVLLRESCNESLIHVCYRAEFARQIPESLAVDRLANELERHRESRSPMVSFVFWNRTRRYVSLLPFGLLGHVEKIYCPYLDHDLFDFLMNVDPQYSMQKRFHDETIRRSYPEFAHIPFGSTGVKAPPQKELDRYYRKAALESLGYLLRNPRSARSRLVKTERFAAMLARSSLQLHPGKLWYLNRFLRPLQMERAVGGIDGL